MKITIVRIKPLSAGKLKAFADVSFDGVIIKGCKIFEGSNGLFAALPSQKGKDEKYYDTVVIPDEALKAEFVRVVIEAYKAQCGSQPSPEQVQMAQDAGLVGGDQEVPF